MPRVHIPPPYRGPTRGAAAIPVQGKTVRECLDAVEALYPGFRAQVVDENGRQHRFVKLFLNGEPIESGRLSTPVGEDDDVEVLAAIAGG